MSVLADLCHRCGEGTLVADITTNSGNLTCNSCGRVAYENPMVSEVQFGETSSGGAVVQGQMVGAGQARAPLHGRQNAMESREQTLNNAKRNIRDLAAALSIPDYIYESACGWFEIALNHNFVQGRRSQNVIAACLYIACRKEKTHHMLIDFSSKLQLSVYSLGATFLKMVRALNIIKLPLADPSIFIAHFAEKLNFDGERKNGKIKVIKDALQIAKRMSDDWIHEGRRPAGVAGACVLIACRMNGFRRTHAEVVSVAHVSEDTLQTRMREFGNTTSGGATVNEFRDKSATYVSTDPPSFIKNLEKEAKLRRVLQARKDELKRIKDNFESPNPEVIKRPIRAANGRPVLPSVVRFSQRQQSKIANQDKSTTNEGNNEENSNENLNADQPENMAGNMDDYEEAPNGVKKRKRTHDSIVSELAFGMFKPEDLQDDIALYEKLYTQDPKRTLYDDPLKSNETDPENDKNKPKNLAKYLPKTQDFLDKISSAETVDDVDLGDETTYFNDKELIKQKEVAWISKNYDYLIEQEQKKLKLETDELAGNTSSQKKKKRSNKVIEGVDVHNLGMQLAISSVQDSESASAAESVQRMLAKRQSNFSKKINYDSLQQLFDNPK